MGLVLFASEEAEQVGQVLPMRLLLHDLRVLLKYVLEGVVGLKLAFLTYQLPKYLLQHLYAVQTVDRLDYLLSIGHVLWPLFPLTYPALA